MPAPAKTLYPGLRPLITEYPTPPPSPGRWPPPRPRGPITLPSGRRTNVLSPAEAAQSISVPNVRMFTFMLDTNASTRSTSSSPRLVGPAIIRSMSWNIGGAAAGLQAIEFGIAPAPVVESDVGINLPRQWRPLMLPFASLSGGDIAGRQGDMQADFVSSAPVYNGNVNIPITDRDFFLTVTNWSSGAAADTFVGHVVIAENVSQEALEAFA